VKAAVFAYSRRGCETARRVRALLEPGQWRMYTVERLAEEEFAPIPKPSRPLYEACFSWAEAVIFVGSCGIAVRQIAPFVRDKRTDPAVICVDELGRFVVPLLSGHIGGANILADRLARGLQAVAVITTATDINGKFSVDAWAARKGCAIGSMHAAKAVSAAILEADVPLKSDFPIVTELPAGVRPGGAGAVGIYLTCGTGEPFALTLRLIPRILHLGIGCRKGTPSGAIEAAVAGVLAERGLDRRAVKCAASIDLKAEEQGLLEFCRENHWPVCFYTAQELAAVEGTFTASSFVQGVTGVDNVCERSALKGAQRLLVQKTARGGVTIAVAAEHWEVDFG